MTTFLGLIILIGWGILIYTYRFQIQACYKQMQVDVECAPLRQKLLRIVPQDTAERLIALAKTKNPDKSERWYLEKVLYDLQRR